MRSLLEGRSIELRVDLVLNSLEAIRLMAQQGLCQTIMPYSIIRRDHEHGLLEVHRLLDGSLQRRLVLATAAGRRLTPATEIVADIIQAIVAEVRKSGGLYCNRATRTPTSLVKMVGIRQSFVAVTATQLFETQLLEPSAPYP